MKLLKLQLFVLLSCIFAISSAQSTNPPNAKWDRLLSGDKDDYVRRVVPSQDGGYYVIGGTKSSKDDFKFCNSCTYGSFQAYIIKLDHKGKTLWSKIVLPAPDNFNDYDGALSAGVEVSDGFIALGYMKTGSSTTNEFHIVKVNKFTGDLIWTRRIGDMRESIFSTHAIVATTEGFIVLGESQTNWKHTILVRLSHEGTEIARRTLPDFPLIAQCIEPTLDDDENSFLGGNSSSGIEAGSEFRLEKTSDNNYIIVGYKENKNVKDDCGCFDSDLRVLKFSPNLTTIWDKTYGGKAYDYFIDMVVHPNSDIVILGKSCDEGSVPYGPFNVNSGTWLLKLNSSGDFKAIENPEFNNSFISHYVNGIELSCDNKLILTGIRYEGFLKYPHVQKKEFDMKTDIWSKSYTDFYFLSPQPFNDVVRDQANNLIAFGTQNSYPDPVEVFIWVLEGECSSTGNCQNALPIQCGQTISGSTIGKTSNFDRTDYNCLTSNSAFDGGDEVYVLEKNSGSGSLHISLVSNTDLDIFLFDRCDATGLNCIGKSTNPRRPSGGNAELIRFDNLPDGKYYIVVDGFRSSENGPFELTVTCGNLSCVSARLLTCNTPVTESNSNGVNNVSTYCGLMNTNGTLNGFAGRGKEKVYSFNIEQAQTVRIDLTGMSQGSDFDIYLLSECNPDKCLGSSYNAGVTNELINVSLNPGLYYVVVESYYDRVGSYTLRVNCTAGGGSIPRPRMVMPTNLSVEAGQEIKFPITASNFTNMAAMEFSLKADNPNILNIVGIEPQAIAPAFNLVSTSNIGISWFSQNQPTVTVPNGQVLFNVILKIIATTGSTDISVTDVPTAPYALTNRNGNLQTVSLDIAKGSIHINQNLVQLCGIVNREDNIPISDVKISVSGSKSTSDHNEANGNYCFTNLPKGGNFTITPEKNTHLRNGINGRDLYLIQRHILGEKLATAYRIIAADYDGSNSINGRDLYLTQRLILGDSSIAPVSSWRFIRKSQKFSDNSNPFLDQIQKSISLTGVNQAQQGLDFIAMKVADVDNSSALEEEILTSRGAAPLILSISKHTAVQNSDVEVKLMVKGFENIISLDYTLQWDTTVIRFLRFEPPTNNTLGLSAGNFESTTNPGKLLSTWFDNGFGKSVSDGTVIARFIFRVVGQNNRSTPIQFVNNPVPLQAYTRTGKVQSDTISGRVTVSTINAIEDQSLEEFYIYPNPFKNILFIENLNDLNGVRIILYDALGKETISSILETGKNEIYLSELKSGMYFYRILGGKNEVLKTGKIVKL